MSGNARKHDIARSQTSRTFYRKIVFLNTIFRTMLEKNKLRSRLATLREENTKERLLLAALREENIKERLLLATLREKSVKIRSQLNLSTSYSQQKNQQSPP